VEERRGQDMKNRRAWSRPAINTPDPFALRRSALNDFNFLFLEYTLNSNFIMCHTIFRKSDSSKNFLETSLLIT
jgi:hypothetical protein